MSVVSLDGRLIHQEDVLLEWCSTFLWGDMEPFYSKQKVELIFFFVGEGGGGGELKGVDGKRMDWRWWRGKGYSL